MRKLTALVERDDAEVFASNRVIGEAYVALQHHYAGDYRRAELTTLTLDRKMSALPQVRRL